MYEPSPAVRWLEEDPESPYNLAKTRITYRDVYDVAEGSWAPPYEVWGASYPPGVISRRAMFTLK